MRLPALLLCALALAACDDTFESPPRPDLHKEPYDFAMKVPADDLGITDLAGADLTKKPDLAMPDLAMADLAPDDAN